MKELHVGESVRVGTPSEEVRGTVVDLDRRPGYGRLIIDSNELSDPHADTGYVSKSARRSSPLSDAVAEARGGEAPVKKRGFA